MNTLDLEQSIVCIGEEAPTEMLLDVGDKIAALGEFYKEIRRQWEAKMIERIEAAGPIVSGDILYRVGNPPTTKCVNVAAAVEAVLTHVGGDFETFCQHLAAGALKHGACKQTLPPEDYDRLFVTERKQELTEDEATPKRLAKLNLAFVR